MNSRAVTIERPGVLRVGAAEPAEPAPGQALIRVAYSGICGSDREVLTGGRPRGYVRYPVVPGHEWSGTVVAVGSTKDSSLLDQPVVGEGFRSCQVCESCRRGDNNLCAAQYDETGFTQPGAWSDYLVMPTRLLHVLPPESDLRAAAVLEPAACVAAAALKLDAQPGEKIAVVGGGSLGLLSAQLVSATSPAELLVVHPEHDRARLAAACGASALLTPEEAEQRRGEFDAVVEAAGASGTADLATRLVRPGGRVVLTGVPSEDTQPPSPIHLVCSQITVHTVFGAPSRAWSHAVRAFVAGVLDPSLIVTREFALDEVSEALRVLAGERAHNVKILLHP